MSPNLAKIQAGIQLNKKSQNLAKILVILLDLSPKLSLKSAKMQRNHPIFRIFNRKSGPSPIWWCCPIDYMFFSSLGQTHVVIRMSKAVEGAGGRSSSGGGGQAWAGLGGAEGGQPTSCRCLSCWGGWGWWWPILEITINHDYFVFQELESKLEASRLRESQLLAEVESVRFF